MINFSHMIFYVKNIQKTLSFYEEAFGMKIKFLHECGAYAELCSGETTLAFVSEEYAKTNLPKGYLSHNPQNPPFACEIVLTTDDVQGTYAKALKAGAENVADPQTKPWGQEVGYVRDPEGILIEIASPIH